MSSLEGDIEESLVSVARAVRARGLKGEIVADLLTDFPERFDGVDRLIALSPSGERTVVELKEFWFQQGRIVLKLAGCNTVEEAREFSGYEFCVPEDERVTLDADQYYDFELEGCVVRVVNGQEIGKVSKRVKNGRR